MDQVNWTCELCETQNLDLRSETARPLCGGCDKDIDWDDIVHVSDDYEAYLNRMDILSGEKFGCPACEMLMNSEQALAVIQDAFDSCERCEVALDKLESIRNEVTLI